MAISSISPVSGSLIEPGDAISFTIDDTYTVLQIEVVADNGTEYAYDLALSGAQGGYTVVVVDNGATKTITFSRDAGWDIDPQVIRVIENETGSTATTSISYNLTTTTLFPQGTQPYDPAVTGTLIITDDGAAVEEQTSWLDIVGATVTDMGNGKVEIDVTAGVAGVASFEGRTGAVVATAGDYTASEITNVPAGGIAAVTVQAAITELDTDKAADADVFHDNVSGEIAALTEKVIPVGDDLFVINDSAASNALKKVKLSSMYSSSVTSVHARTGAVVGEAGDYTASEITNVPAGGVAAVTVQAAIDELDTDKAVDSAVFHKATAGEIAALTTVSVASGDYILIEDVSDSNNKKKILASDVMVGGTDATVALAGVIGIPTRDTMQEKDDAQGGVGIVSGGGITDDADGTITVAAGTGFIRATDSDTAALLSFDFSAEAGANVTLTDDDLNYIYIEYNAGAPRTIATTTERTDYNTNIFLGTVYRDGTTLHITQIPIYTGNGARQTHRFHTETDGLKRASGSIISATGTRNFALTSGVWWVGMDRFTIAAIDTSGADRFTYYYRDGVGGWTTQTSQSQINNTNYDDGTGTLATLGGTDYGVHWVYRGLDDDCYVLYGRDNYTSGQAAAATPPTDVPGHFEGYHVALVGKIVIREGDAAFHTIETPFTTVFTSSGVVNHNELAGLSADDHTQYILDPGTVTDNAIVRWDSTTGRVVQDSANSTLGDNSDLALNGSSAEILMAEKGSVSDPGAGKGRWWIKNDSPSRAMFTDDTNVTYPINHDTFYFPLGGRLTPAGNGAWYGPAAAGWSDLSSGWQLSFGSGADPAVSTMTWHAHPIVPADMVITKLYTIFQVSATSVTGKMRLYRISGITDGSASYTMTQVGSDISLSGKSSTTVAYVDNQTGLSATCLRGDKLMMFVFCDTNFASTYFSIAISGRIT